MSEFEKVQLIADFAKTRPHYIALPRSTHINTDASMNPSDTSPSPRRNLSLLDSICIIVGTIIGSGIFRASSPIAGMTGNPLLMVTLWIVGGLIVMVGAGCFIELTTRFPDEAGGDYAYLKKSWGHSVAFLFAWAAFWVVRPANIGTMAIVFADHFVNIAPSWMGQSNILFALLAVIVLSATNLIGIRQGTSIQNILTIAKVLGIAAIIAAALYSPAQAADPQPASAGGSFSLIGNFWTPLVLVMFCYGGWNDLAMVSSEIKSPHKNLWRALVIGIAVVITVYVAFNLSLCLVLGQAATASSESPAIDLVKTAIGQESYWGGQAASLIAGLVCVSCLGAINGMIITSPRIYFAVGKDYPALAFLAKWDQQRSCPWQAILIQASIAAAMLLVCATENVFEILVNASAPWFWIFLGLTVLSLFKFRTADTATTVAETTTTAFRVPLFPIAPLFFAAVCVGITISSTQYLIGQGFGQAAIFIGILMLIGVILNLFLKRSEP